jgi:hypothetical protein
MLYREIIAVYSEIHTKHINTLCGQNVEFLNAGTQVSVATGTIQSVHRNPAAWMVQGSTPGEVRFSVPSGLTPRPRSFLYNGYWGLPGDNAAGAWC